MIENPVQLYEAAVDYASRKHAGQVRIGGAPYISHPLAVAEILRGQGLPLSYQLTALFHDLLEDTDATEDEIAGLAGPEVLRAVRLLTKTKGYDMEEYMAGIRADSLAFAVKGADRLHNLNCALTADEDFRRQYLLETLDWYLDFHPDIPAALKQLNASLSRPLAEMSLIYQPVETWKLNPQTHKGEKS